MTSEHETPQAAPQALPYTHTIRWLSAGGGLLAILCAVLGVAMLLLKWAGSHPAAIISQVPLVLFPVAFITLMFALILSVLRRKAS